jgi:hypothetical protein
MSEHHPSCRPSDKELVWLCHQCGGHESAEDIELDGARLDWLEKNPKEITFDRNRWWFKPKRPGMRQLLSRKENRLTLRNCIDAARGLSTKPDRSDALSV